MIRTCLFDMGNVLLHFSHDRMCQQMGTLCRKSGDDLRRLLLDSGVQWEFERGLLTAEEFHRRFQELVGTMVDLNELIVAASDIFEVNRPMIGILDSLKAQQVRLVLFSNTSVWHYQFIRKRFDLLDRFDECVLSFEVGAIKPETEMYRAGLRAIRCAPSECFYTDDIPRYVEAARKYGFDGEVFTDADQLVRQLAARGVDL
jgi:putative hydrolase of the HAD superfamily